MEPKGTTPCGRTPRLECRTNSTRDAGQRIPSVTEAKLTKCASSGGAARRRCGATRRDAKRSPPSPRHAKDRHDLGHGELDRSPCCGRTHAGAPPVMQPLSEHRSRPPLYLCATQRRGACRWGRSHG